MKIIDASTTGVTRLYHYQSYDPQKPERIKRLKQIVAGQAIYMSNPEDFNDPWDCRPFFNDDVSNPDDRERWVRYIARAARKAPTRLPIDEHTRRVAALRSDPSLLRAAINEVTTGIEAVIQRVYRVYCLTTKQADTLMWSHYADNHRGICLEFGCDNAKLSAALKVEYRDTYPLLDLTDDDDDEALQALLTKASAWGYEDEYRLIAQEKTEALNLNSLITVKSLLDLPTNALKSIILGCSASHDVRDEVTKIVQASGRDIALKQAVRVANRYELSIEPLNRASAMS